MLKEEFENIYWSYYRNLEDDFLATERYVAFDVKNDSTFSIEYIGLLQTICSEIDTLLKELCKLKAVKPKEKKLPYYFLALRPVCPEFFSEEISIKKFKNLISPWSDISYVLIKGKDCKMRLDGHSPTWWDAYNATKHRRTEKDGNNSFNYEKANQVNVRYALAALFQIESYIYQHLTGKNMIVIDHSKLFKMAKWKEDYILLDETEMQVISEQEIEKMFE